MKLKSILLAILITVCSIVLIVICLIIWGGHNNENTTIEDEAKITSTEEKVTHQLENMSLAEKIGQLLYVVYSSNAVDDRLKDTIKSVKPGGFIIFENNITNKNQLKEYIDTLQNLSDTPMFIGIDQEGGIVQRLKPKGDITATNIPPMYNVGKICGDDKDLPYDIGYVIGRELSVFGINMNFAPVVDIYSNPNNTVIGKRAFSNTSDNVSEMALNVGKGLGDNNIIPVYKHFPGHGDTKEDSHYTLPILNKSYEELSNLELVPYFDLIENGIDAIMVAHIALPKITGDNVPASLNKKVVNDILRDKLGFKGLVVTDGVNMRALSDNYSTKEIVCMAVDAGVDMILMPNTSKDARDGLMECLNEGKITVEQIDAAVKRILTLKYNRGLFNDGKTPSFDTLEDINYLEKVTRIKQIR